MVIMKELAIEIATKWQKFKDRCKWHHPRPLFDVGTITLTEERCGNERNRSKSASLELGRCTVNRCPLIKQYTKGVTW